MTGVGRGVQSRREFVGVVGGLAAGLALGRGVMGQEATPAASPGAGEWTYTDVLGTTVTLPARPVRIAANLATAAALWDLGIRVVAVFDWTASAFPEGDHIAWGNVDPKAVANVGDADGNILPEDMLVVQPDVIFTLTYDPDDPGSTAGVLPTLAERIGAIAPVLVVTDMASTEIQLQRLVDLGAMLGADLEAEEVVAAKGVYEAKVAEFREVAAEKADLTSLFMDFDPGAIYAAGPQGVAELQFLGSLGLQFANAGSPAATEFWDLSPQTSTIFGCVFLGASGYFFYVARRSFWIFGLAPLLGFLGYDLVLLAKYTDFLRHPSHYIDLFRGSSAATSPSYGAYASYGSSTTSDSVNELSLAIYLAVLVISALLAIFLLFIYRPTRLQPRSLQNLRRPAFLARTAA